MTLTGRFDDITFAGPSAITTLSSTFFIQHPNQDKGPLSTIQAKTLRLPEGLETLGARALAAGAYGYFISNQQIDLRTALHIKQLLLPSTLRSIGEAAFFSAQIQEPVTLPQRLRTIGPLAFYASSLPEITLPESLQRIDDQAFALCGSLETVRALGKTLRYWALWLSSARQSRGASSVSSSHTGASQRTSRQAMHRSSSTS